jgi:hypothetical protein
MRKFPFGLWSEIAYSAMAKHETDESRPLNSCSGGASRRTHAPAAAASSKLLISLAYAWRVQTLRLRRRAEGEDAMMLAYYCVSPVSGDSLASAAATAAAVAGDRPLAG